MKCPYCGFEDTKVIDSRPADSKKEDVESVQTVQKDLQHMKLLKFLFSWYKKKMVLLSLLKEISL